MSDSETIKTYIICIYRNYCLIFSLENGLGVYIIICICPEKNGSSIVKKKKEKIGHT